MYKCKCFEPYELVPKHIYEKRGEKSYQLFDDRLLRFLDKTRELLKVPMTIDDWYWGGDRQWSGLRTPESPYYSETSQHSLGRAVDFICEIPAVEVRRMMREWVEQGLYGDISITLEHGEEITWVHVDFRNSEPGYNWFNV